MKKSTKAIIAGSVIGASLTLGCALGRLIRKDAFAVDPDTLFFTDEEIERIEEQARRCHSRSDNVEEKEKKDCFNSDVKRRLHYDGKNYRDENGKVLSENEVAETIKKFKTVVIDSKEDIPLEEIERLILNSDKPAENDAEIDEILSFLQSIFNNEKKG